MIESNGHNAVASDIQGLKSDGGVNSWSVCPPKEVSTKKRTFLPYPLCSIILKAINRSK